MKPDKILQIAYYFPPIKVVGAMRNHRIYTSLKAVKAKVFVFTTSNRKFMVKEKAQICASDVFPIRTLDSRKVARLLGFKKNHIPEKNKSSAVLRFLLYLKELIPFALFLADGGLLYVGHGLWKGFFLIKKEKINTLYSSFSPFADHFIAFCLKICYPKLFWIADFRDFPLFYAAHHPLFRKIQWWFLKKILKNADLVTTVSAGLAQPFKEINLPVYVVRNGFKKEKPVSPATFYSTFTIAYSGSLYPSHQTASPLFLAIQQIYSQPDTTPPPLQVIYAGKDPEVWQAWVDQANLPIQHTTLPLLSLPEAEKIQRNAHLNLLLTWAEPKRSGILTAKLFSYLKAGRPILAIAKGARDRELEQILKKMPHSQLFSDKTHEVAAMKKYLLQLITLYTDHPNMHVNTPLTLDAYSWDTQFNRLLKRIASTRKPDFPPENSSQ